MLGPIHNRVGSNQIYRNFVIGWGGVVQSSPLNEPSFNCPLSQTWRRLQKSPIKIVQSAIFVERRNLCLFDSHKGCHVFLSCDNENLT